MRQPPNIVLWNIPPELAQKAADTAALEAACGLILGGSAALVADVIGLTEAMRSANGAPPEWGGYLAADASSRAVIGTCAYKDAPDAAGAVEIAYFTFPEFEGRGYGTAMAAALVERAARDDGVLTIRAHTLPEPNASTRILGRNGFVHLGTVEDPEDGLVWRWERSAR